MKPLKLPGAVQSGVQQHLVNEMNCKLPLCVTSHESRKKNFNKGRIAELLQINTLHLWIAVSGPRAQGEEDKRFQL